MIYIYIYSFTKITDNAVNAGMSPASETTLQRH